MSTPEDSVIDALIDRLKQGIGVAGTTRVSPPITATDIRRWAIAVYYPETPPARYWDPAGDITAPEELNPFAWPIDRTQGMYRHIERGPSGMSLNAGTEVEYGVPMRPGDVITGVATPYSVTEKPGKNGRMIFYTVEDVWTNQRGEIVKKYRLTQVLR